MISKLRRYLIASSLLITVVSGYYSIFYVSFLSLALFVFAVSTLTLSFLKEITQKHRLIFAAFQTVLLLINVVLYTPWLFLCRSDYDTGAFVLFLPESFRGQPLMNREEKLFTFTIDNDHQRKGMVNVLKSLGWTDRGKGRSSGDPSGKFDRVLEKKFFSLPFTKPTSASIIYEMVETNNEEEEFLWLGHNPLSEGWTPYQYYIPSRLTYSITNINSRLHGWILNKRIAQDISKAFNINYTGRSYFKLSVDQTCFDNMRVVIP